MHFTLARSRSQLRLGQEIGRGGEGVVYSVLGDRSQVAKVYTHPPDARKARKLKAMTAAANSTLLKIAAWPIDILLDSGKDIRGLVMPSVSARRDIHELYSPRSRCEAFPEADFRFLVHVAANVARAFAVVHDLRHVVGDVNHGNLMVGPDGTVMFIDCDSFQFNSSSEIFTCDVGVPLFTAPELHGKSFRGLIRTPDHDRFGLAILLFHILFMGRHPFAGRFSGSGDMPIERAIAEFRFAYGPQRSIYGMRRPPGAIELEAMGTSVAAHFTGAFSPSGARSGRPDARSWLSILEQLKGSLRSCPTASWHQYPETGVDCLWCRMENRSAVRLFGERLVHVRDSIKIDVDALWRAIVSVEGPGIEPALPHALPWSLPSDLVLPNRVLTVLRKLLALSLVVGGLIACNATVEEGGIILALIIYALAFAAWPRIPAGKRAAVGREYTAATSEWQEILARWEREASATAYAREVQELSDSRKEIVDLPNERRRRLASLSVHREGHQRQLYLDRFRIDRAKIRGVGDERTAMLASCGIETAADVDSYKIRQIRGFGETLTLELIRWREKHERNFVFNPHQPVDPRLIRSLDNDLALRRDQLVMKLRQGPSHLRRRTEEIRRARTRLYPDLEKIWIKLKIAEAMRKAF